MPVPVASGVTYSGQLVGQQVFQSHDRQAPEFLGSTGVAAGTGTANITGDVWLSMAHTLTKHDDAANPGIAAGTESASGDTILGAHTLTVDYDGAGGTVRLDGGQVVTFAGTETNLQLLSPSGDVVYLDVSSMTGVPYTGELTIRGEGKLSVDNGESWTSFTDADFADGNISVSRSDTGKFLYIDGATVKRTGVEPIRIQGTYDLFTMLIDIRDILNNEQGITEQQQLAALRRAGDAVSEVTSSVIRHSTTTGSRLEALDRLRGSLEQLKANTDNEAGLLQSADLIEVATELARANTLYQVTLQTAAKLLNQTLVDYI